jgi:hypothetical protein
MAYSKAKLKSSGDRVTLTESIVFVVVHIIKAAE